jgi:hypothetical protein
MKYNFIILKNDQFINSCVKTKDFVSFFSPII